MEEYYFLFIVALVWILIACIYDLKIREVPNWLNFSLIVIVLSYRLFYSILNDDLTMYTIYSFILIGIASILFYLLYISYYKFILKKRFNSKSELYDKVYSTLVSVIVILVLLFDYFTASLTNIFDKGGLSFFFFGFVGIAVFFIVANVFYYGRVFGGGDAKLLIGLGGVLPTESYLQLGIYGSLFIISLLFIGAFYSLIASGFIVSRNKDKFRKEFEEILKSNWKILTLVTIIAFVLWFFLYHSVNFHVLFFIVFLVAEFLFIYVKSLEKSCMIKFVNVKDLREGDSLNKILKIGKKVIGNNVHGLSLDEIRLIRRNYRKVEVREGIPFVPAFLITFLIMLYVFFSLTEFLPLLHQFL